MTSRAIAIRCLVTQARSREPVDQILNSLLADAPLKDERDRQLAMALIYGVLRHRQELDAVLRLYTKTPLGKLKAVVLQALRIGLIQLLFMDRIPPSAAVNETIKGLGRQPAWLKGFVNGVLRTMVRDMAGMLDHFAALPATTRLNHPQWLVALWEEQFGQEQARALCTANNIPPQLTLRLNPRLVSMPDFLHHLAAVNIAGQKGRFAEQAVVLTDYHGSIEALPGYGAGWFHVQDEAAQLIADFFKDQPTGAYLDGCAGLGGKTILLDQTLPPQSALSAVEPHGRRHHLLSENLRRCRCRPISLHAATLQEFSHGHEGTLQGVLLDAPCSGLGIIRRQPDIRWNRSPADLENLATQQLALLSTAAPLLQVGGIIVYVTCSLATKENEEVIAAFLADHPDFVIMPPHLAGPAGDCLTGQGFLRTMPTQGLDGFFAARLCRRS